MTAVKKKKVVSGFVILIWLVAFVVYFRSSRSVQWLVRLTALTFQFPQSGKLSGLGVGFWNSTWDSEGSDYLIFYIQELAFLVVVLFCLLIGMSTLCILLIRSLKN